MKAFSYIDRLLKKWAGMKRKKRWLLAAEREDKYGCDVNATRVIGYKTTSGTANSRTLIRPNAPHK